MKKLLITFLLFSFNLFVCLAQLPNTDNWLLTMSQKNNKLALENPKNITDRNGYDNQPVFSPDGTYILYTSIRDSLQSDIYKYEISTNTILQHTNTSTSEYSPTFMPGGKSISVVMVEKDSAQRLWSFPVRGGKPECILKNIDSVGYHCWFSKNRLGLFVLTKPFTLQLAGMGKQTPYIIADSIGRCIKMNNHMMYYTRKNDKGENYLYQFNLPGLNSRMLMKLPGEDFCFQGQQIIATSGSKVFVTDASGSKWILVSDLAPFGINNLGRIAINSDGTKIAVVSEKK